MLKNESLKEMEDNDCSVRTLSTLCDLSYNEAHKVLESYGRLPREGFVVRKLTYNTINNKFIVPIVIKKRYIVSELESVKKLEKGLYMISIKDHVFSLVNGKIIDDSSEDYDFSNEKVQEIYELRAC